MGSREADVEAEDRDRRDRRDRQQADGKEP
jgi:hypothetical protein